MNLKINHLKILSLLVFVVLAGCGGVFEVNLENTDEPGISSPVTTVATQPSPTNIPSGPTENVVIDDEAAIRQALAERLGLSAEQPDIRVMQNTGIYATGQVSNGYFLAAKDKGTWVIVYDGQATPPCKDIDAYQFPTSMVPECLDENNNLIMRASGSVVPGEDLLSLSCQDASEGSAEYVACNIQDGLRSRNISALRGYMADPFFIAYWRSEGVSDTPAAILTMLPDLYNYNDPNYNPRLTFTTDRSQFPQLGGQSPEDFVSPELDIALVVYSQGWGEDGQGAAFLYIAQDGSGNYYWPGMIYSFAPFDE